MGDQGQQQQQQQGPLGHRSRTRRRRCRSSATGSQQDDAERNQHDAELLWKVRRHRRQGNRRQVRNLLAPQHHDLVRTPRCRKGNPRTQDRGSAGNSRPLHRRHAPRRCLRRNRGRKEGQGRHGRRRPRQRRHCRRHHPRPHQGGRLQVWFHPGRIPPNPRPDQGPRQDAIRGGRRRHQGHRAGGPRFGTGGAHHRPMDPQKVGPLVPRQVRPPKVDEEGRQRRSHCRVDDRRPYRRTVDAAQGRHRQGSHEAIGGIPRRDRSHSQALPAQRNRQGRQRQPGHGRRLGRDSGRPETGINSFFDRCLFVCLFA
mmetsp:Transcript_15062/g.34728  ORF Transcript_15062/g.34728 Transcript_15062/m.34728 type:complete len:312 (+) Transcript_15062:718-1653(+)